MTKKSHRRVAGAAAGFVNGIFGGGGGMVLLPLLVRWGGVEGHAAFANCVSVIYPMCVVSAVVYCLRVQPDVLMLLPYLLGGIAGGILSGLTFQKVPVRILKLIFGGFLIYGGVRYLL